MYRICFFLYYFLSIHRDRFSCVVDIDKWKEKETVREMATLRQNTLSGPARLAHKPAIKFRDPPLIQRNRAFTKTNNDQQRYWKDTSKVEEDCWRWQLLWGSSNVPHGGKTVMFHSTSSPRSNPAHIANATSMNSYTKQEKYRDVIELLHSGAVSLLKAKQSGSGSDLAIYMIETYKLANTPVTEESLGMCPQNMQ